MEKLIKEYELTPPSYRLVLGSEYLKELSENLEYEIVIDRGLAWESLFVPKFTVKIYKKDK